MDKVSMRTVGVCLLLGLALLAFGQATDGNLVGVVTDPTGATVPNAKLQLQNTATGVVFNGTSNTNGEYRFNNVPVGNYKLTVNAPSFTTATIQNVNIQLNKTQTVNVPLEIGQVSTSIEVTEAAAQIDTTTAQLQTTFNSEHIVNLPIVETSGNMYGALNLSLLGAGVASNGGVGQGTGPSVGGQRPMNNNFEIEGVDNNNKGITGPLVYVPTEATAEFTLLQNQFAPEFGHSSGGQFNTIIKSGGNDVHGSLYEYMQNRNFNALDQAFARQGILSQPRFDQNRLGASIGGPIKKNKLFYFGNFEYAPMGAAITNASPIESPTAAGFSLLDSMSGLSQTNYSIFKKYMPPAPAQTGTDSVTVLGRSIPIGIVPITGSFFTNQYTAIGSVDYNISDRDQVRGRMIYNKISALDDLASLPAFWIAQPNKYYLATISEFHNFGPSVVNELRLGYNRFFQDYPVPNIPYPGLDVFPNIEFNNDLGVNIGPDGNAPQSTVQNTYQLVDNVNWTKGKHTMKFGFDGRKFIAPQVFVQRVRGDYSYTGLEGFLLDQVPDDLAERNVGNTKYYGDQVALYGYFGDQWRMFPNFTVDLGVRYEFNSVPYTVKLQRLNHISDVPGVLTFDEPKPQTKNFAPRIGIAYSPGKSGTTSIRAGFGMAYDILYDNIGLVSYPPQLSSTVDAYPDTPPYSAPFLGQGGIKPNAVGTGILSAADARAATSAWLPRTFVQPYSIQWNFGVQHVFHKDYTLEARYLGTRGVHLPVQSRINSLSRVTPDHYLPTYLTAPDQATLNSLPWTLNKLKALPNNSLEQYGFAANITSFLPEGNSLYNGLALQLNKRFSNDLQFIGAYTWSHNLDNSTASLFSTILTPRRPQDFQNLRADWSSSALDRRQRFTMSWVYDTPWFRRSDNWFLKNLVGNFMFVGTYTAETGELVDPQSGVDSNLNGDTAGDRTIVNPKGISTRGSGVTALKNSAGDIVGYLANDPTARYIQAGLGALANAGRNTLQMPGINNFDLSLGKNFNITESKKLELRLDAANAFNHPQFTAGYINSVRLTSQTNTRTFLVPTSSSFADWAGNFSSNPRTVQLAARFTF